MQTREVVFIAPDVAEDLGLKERVEELAVQELIAEPGVEGLGEAVLPGGSRLDEDRRRAVESVPVTQGVRDELRPVDCTAELRCGPSLWAGVPSPTLRTSPHSKVPARESASVRSPGTPPVTLTSMRGARCMTCCLNVRAKHDRPSELCLACRWSVFPSGCR